MVAVFTWATGFRKIPPKSKPCGEDHKVDLFVSCGITHLKPIPDHPLGSQRAGASQIILPPHTLNCRWSLPARGNHLWQRFTTDSLNGESAKRSAKSPARPAEKTSRLDTSEQVLFGLPHRKSFGQIIGKSSKRPNGHSPGLNGFQGFHGPPPGAKQGGKAQSAGLNKPVFLAAVWRN